MDLAQWRTVSKNCTVSVGQWKIFSLVVAYLDFKLPPLCSSFDFPFYLSVMLQTGIDITQPRGTRSSRSSNNRLGRRRKRKEEHESGEK
jgi:hypothetical protein